MRVAKSPNLIWTSDEVQPDLVTISNPCWGVHGGSPSGKRGLRNAPPALEPIGAGGWIRPGGLLPVSDDADDHGELDGSDYGIDAMGLIAVAWK